MLTSCEFWKPYPDEAEYLAYQREAFERGYERHYDWNMEGISENTVSDAEASEISDILHMFNEMQYTYDALSDKTGIDEGRIGFYGFDANNEGKQLAYARYFCKDNGTGESYPQIKLDGENWNSHAPFLPMYRAMLVEWHKCSNKHCLTTADLIRLTSVEDPENH